MRGPVRVGMCVSPCLLVAVCVKVCVSRLGCACSLVVCASPAPQPVSAGIVSQVGAWAAAGELGGAEGLQGLMGLYATPVGLSTVCPPDAPHANGGLHRRESQGSVSSAGSLDLVSRCRPVLLDPLGRSQAWWAPGFRLDPHLLQSRSGAGIVSLPCPRLSCLWRAPDSPGSPSPGVLTQEVLLSLD